MEHSSEDNKEPGSPNPQAHRRDLELVRRVLRGDSRAVEELIQRLQCVPKILYRVNERFRGHTSESDLSDLSQDVLVLIWQKLRTFQGRSTLETWAYGFCVMVSLNRSRRAARRRTVHQGGYDAAVRDLAAPEESRPVAFEAVEIGLRDVGASEAEVIRLKHFEGKTFREIGEQLEISTNTAKTQYYRGLDLLRRRVQRLEENDR